jgi:uridine kinase
MERKPYLVGITGGSGSGKTYFLNQLLDGVGKENICLISQDNYYRPLRDQPVDKNGVSNFDTPESLDFVAYTKDVMALCAGQTIERQEYTFNSPTVKPKILVFESRPIIIVEGIFVLYYKEIAKLMDLKLFIEAKEAIKIKRRIIRDNKERGYDLNDVLYRYENHVLPAYENYIEPVKGFADLIVPNNKQCKRALRVVISHLKSKL